MIKKWEDKIFEPIEIAEIEEAFNEEYSEHLKDDESFEAEISFKNDIFYLSIILQNKDKSFYYPIETRVFHKDNKDIDATKTKESTIDFISSYFHEYFVTDKDTFIPIEWAPYKFMDLNIQAKGQIRNKKLDDEAEKLLAETEIKN